MNIYTLSQEFKEALYGIYGANLYKLYLFGSYARGDFHEDSDVDFLVVLKDPQMRSFTEISKMSPLLSQFLKKYHRVFSVVPARSHDFETLQTPLYQNVKMEGIEI